MNTDKLQAGRELDALIAEKVMRLPGLERGDSNKYCGVIGHAHPQTEGEYYYRRDGSLSDPIPCYSTDIAAAWQVVEKIKEDRKAFRCFADGIHDLCGTRDSFADYSVQTVLYKLTPLIICKAALMAMETE